MKRIIVKVLLGISIITPFANESKKVKTPVVAKEAAMSIQDALQRAAKHSVQIQAAEYGQSAAQFQRAGAIGQALLPEVNASITSVDTKNKNQSEWKKHHPTQEISVQYNVLDNLRSTSAVGKAHVGVKQANLNYENTYMLTLQEVINAYLGVFNGRKIVKAFEKHVSASQNFLRRAQTEYKIGKSTRTNVLMAEAELAKAKAGLIEQKTFLKNATQMFKRLVGLAPGNLVEPKLVLKLPSNVEEAVMLAKRQNVKVRGADYKDDSAIIDVVQTSGAFLPTLSVSWKWNKEAWKREGALSQIGYQDSSTFSIRGQINLFRGGVDAMNVAAAAKKKAASRLLLEHERQQAEQDVTNAWEEWLAAKATLDQRKAEVRAQELALDAMKNEERLGKQSFLKLLETETKYINSSLQHIQAEQDYVLKQVKILNLMGELTPAKLGMAAV